MVMHARKFPRLNDGYYDRNQAHPYETADQYPSKSHGGQYNDQYCDKASPNFTRHRDDSPSNRHTYHNKSSYIDRTKDRASMDREKRANHHPSSSSFSYRSENDHHSNHDRLSKETREQKEKEHRAEQVQKNALRVCGDWSEHISSSRKKYYYNCKTEQSQWEKPKDWVDLPNRLPSEPTRSNQGHGHDKPLHSGIPSSKSTEDRYRHSSGSDRYEKNSSRSSSSILSRQSLEKLDSSLQPSFERHKPSVSKYNATAVEVPQKIGVIQQRTTSWPRAMEHAQRDSHRRDVPLSGARSTDVYGFNRFGRREQYNSVNRPPADVHNGARSVDVHRNESEDSRQTEDMDISPGSTPTNSRPNSRPQSRTGTPIVSTVSTTPGSMTMTTPPSSLSAAGSTPKSVGSNVLGALPQLISQLDGKTLQKVDSQELTQQALQTLQKLQQAISKQASVLVQNALNQSPRSAPDTSPFQPLQSPHVNASSQVTVRPQLTASALKQLQAQTAEEERERERAPDSPRSGSSCRSSRPGSPTPSQGSSQGIPVNTSSLAAAGIKQPSVQLTPSLSNYYCEKLTTHVMGWQADHAERQADRYSEEAHNVGSSQCTQVSVDLKKARSLVRIAEIQSTLQEQRILFLRQEIKDLDNWSRQTTFMPTQEKSPAESPPKQ